MDTLASEYVGQPVVFLEYDVDSYYDRALLWWAAHGYGTTSLPMAMVSSGHQWADGSAIADFYAVYKNMIRAELARPPQALIMGSAERIGDRLKFTVLVTNQSNVTLSSANMASVHVLIYEERRIGLTGRFVHQALSQRINTALVPNAQASFTLETQPLTNVQWDALRFVALVDYLPAGSPGAYDQLQAAFLQMTGLASQPEAVALLVDSQMLKDTTVTLTITAPPGEQWSVTEDSPWFTVSPATGVSGDTLHVNIQAAALSNGWQEGSISLTTAGISHRSMTIPVRVYVGEIDRIYLPFVHKTP